MTFADHLLGPAAVAVLFRQVWDNGVAAYNFLFCGSFVLCGRHRRLGAAAGGREPGGRGARRA